MMIRIIACVLLFLDSSVAQGTGALPRVRGGKNISYDSYEITFGRTHSLRSTQYRELESDLSMSLQGSESSTAAVEETQDEELDGLTSSSNTSGGCMVDDDCAGEGTSCDCYMNCKLCLSFFAPCGTCV